MKLTALRNQYANSDMWVFQHTSIRVGTHSYKINKNVEKIDANRTGSMDPSDAFQ